MIVETTSFDVQPRQSDINYQRAKLFDEILRKVVPFAPGHTLVDLGAGHCSFAKKARDFGYAVTAVDGRTVRRPDDLGSIRFVLADVRTFDPGGFDVVLNLGLLYHLTLDDQVSLLTRSNAAPYSIVETQVHDPARVGPAFAPAGFSALLAPDGYEGVMAKENSEVGAIGNLESFWHTQASLLRLFENTGYTAVNCIEPQFMSKYGVRQYYVLKGAAR
jgi:hypothetical protein